MVMEQLLGVVDEILALEPDDEGDVIIWAGLTGYNDIMVRLKEARESCSTPTT